MRLSALSTAVAAKDEVYRDAPHSEADVFRPMEALFSAFSPYDTMVDRSRATMPMSYFEEIDACDHGEAIAYP